MHIVVSVGIGKMKTIAHKMGKYILYLPVVYYNGLAYSDH